VSTNCKHFPCLHVRSCISKTAEDGCLFNSRCADTWDPYKSDQHGQGQHHACIEQLNASGSLYFVVGFKNKNAESCVADSVDTAGKPGWQIQAEV